MTTPTTSSRPLAVITGASSGIGWELGKICAMEGFDLLVAADRPEIAQAATDFEALGAMVEAIQVVKIFESLTPRARRSEVC